MERANGNGAPYASLALAVIGREPSKLISSDNRAPAFSSSSPSPYGERVSDDKCIRGVSDCPRAPAETQAPVRACTCFRGGHYRSGASPDKTLFAWAMQASSRTWMFIFHGFRPGSASFGGLTVCLCVCAPRRAFRGMEFVNYASFVGAIVFFHRIVRYERTGGPR